MSAAASKILPTQPSTGSQMSVNNPHTTPVSAKTKLSNSIANPGITSVVHSSYTTQHLPKFLSSSKFLMENGEYYLNEDGTIGEAVDKRAYYSSRLPPDYKHILQDHSYSQLPESPLPPSTPPQRSTINGFNRITGSSVGPTKVTLNNNRIVSVGGANISSYPSQTSSGGGGRRLSGQLSLPHVQNSINCGGYPSTLVNNALGGNYLNGASVIALNPRKGSKTYSSSSSPLAQLSKSVLRAGIFSDKPEESDLSEDDRLPDPHGEETETAPEGEEESVTRCICDFEHDDGDMICCDKCLVWQHVVCMGIDWRNIPDEYLCEQCQPRYIDKQRAIEIQKRKLDNKSSADSKNKKNQPTKRKYKQRRTTGGAGSSAAAKRSKNTATKDAKEPKPRKNAQVRKRPAVNNDSSGNPLPASSGGAHNNMTPERKKQLLIERKQMLEKKQMTKKRSIRKQAQNTKRNSEKNKQLDNDVEYKFGGSYADRVDSGVGGGDHPIQKVRDWVDRYEEAVTNHYSQELRARLSAVQVNGVHSDLKFTVTLKSVEKCRTSLLSTGGKILLTTNNVSSNQAIIELRGKYMWTGASSFKQQNISSTSPYVFYYRLPKNDIEICVDCRTYGNFARFVRRSCKPNAELRHCVRKTSLHLYLIATEPLKKNSEILIGHYSPDTADTCVCGSLENCTASKTAVYTSSLAVTSKLHDKLAKESQNVRSTSPLSSDSNLKSKKTPVNAADKTTKKKIVEEKKKLTKEKRRGRRKSPSGSNSDRESSSRDQSPLAPTKLMVNMWSKPSLGSTSSTEPANKADEKTTEGARVEKEVSSPKIREDEEPTRKTDALSDEKSVDEVKTEPNLPSSSARSNSNERKNSTSDTTTPKKTSRQSDYARKEKQQLDYPLFFQTPKNHKMTREEKKIQAIMKAFEQLEKTEARKQETQKYRRESTSSDATCGGEAGKKPPVNRKNPTTVAGRSRKNTEESKDDERPSSKGRKDSIKVEPVENDEDDDDDNNNDGNVTGGADGKTEVVTNGELRIEQERSETADDEESDDDDDESDGEEEPTSEGKIKLKRNEQQQQQPRKIGAARSRATKTIRQVRCTPKARATVKTKAVRCKKRKSESDPENADDGADSSSIDANERTRGAVLRNKITQYGVEMRRRNVQRSPIGKLRQTDDTTSPYSTPPNMRERLDSSSSSGGTPPTPVSETCLLVAAAVGHLTDFKFPNTKKELINAWFKEERKPSPEEENAAKQEGNNECAKKRWLRQAISEEGDSSVLRPEESMSPNGDYGGPLKKRRFARESMSENMDESSVLNALVNANQDSASVIQTSTPSQETTKSAVVVGESQLPFPITAPPPPPPPPSVPPPEPPPPPPSTPPPSPSLAEQRSTSSVTSPPSGGSGENTTPKMSSPAIAKKKLSLTEYQKRKNVSSSIVTTPSSKCPIPVTTMNQETGTTTTTTTATTTTTTTSITNLLSIAEKTVEREKRSPSRSSVTSSSASEDEDDDSHSASAQVIARSLMIENRHLSYGPQASALFNSLRSNSIGKTSNSPAFGTKSSTPASDIPRENLADRLKREFNVLVTKDDGDKTKSQGLSTVSTLKSLVPMPVPMPAEMVRMKTSLCGGGGPPTPHQMQNMGVGAGQFLPPLPDAPQLFVPAPAYYSYPISGVPSPFFATPPPPPPPLPVPPPTLTANLAPPPPPPSK